MTTYIDCEMPSECRAAMIAQGARPIKAMVWPRKDKVSYSLLSDDPSGPNGEIERHVSVSASSRGVGRRMPSKDEVQNAAAALGVDFESCDLQRQGLTVHLFCKVTTHISGEILNTQSQRICGVCLRVDGSPPAQWQQVGDEIACSPQCASALDLIEGEIP